MTRPQSYDGNVASVLINNLEIRVTDVRTTLIVSADATGRREIRRDDRKHTATTDRAAEANVLVVMLLFCHEP